MDHRNARRSPAVLFTPVLWAFVMSPLAAQTVAAPFDASYTLSSLGAPQNVPASFGGLMLKHDDPDTLLIGGNANSSAAMIYAVPLTRTCGRITGFASPGTPIAAAPNIDGGLVYAPNGTILFTRFNNNHVGQILPGSGVMNKTVDLTGPGVAGSVGTCQFVSAGLPGAGDFKVLSYGSSRWYSVGLVPDGAGTFDIGAVSPAVQLQGGPEGVVFIPAGSPQFPSDSVLVSEFTAGLVVAYQIDANANPIPSTRRVFISGLGGAEGAHIDRNTGDFMFSTFGGGSRVVIVRGFTSPCAGDANADDRIDFLDLNIVLGAFGQSFPGIPGDLNNDCTVDFLDLNIVLGRFGIICDG